MKLNEYLSIKDKSLQLRAMDAVLRQLPTKENRFAVYIRVVGQEAQQLAAGLRYLGDDLKVDMYNMSREYTFKKIEAQRQKIESLKAERDRLDSEITKQIYSALRKR